MSFARAIGSRIQGEPSYSAGAVMAIINLLVVFNVVTLNPAQLSAINTVVAAVLAVAVRHAVTPVSGTPLAVTPKARAARAASVAQAAPAPSAPSAEMTAARPQT